MLTRRLRDDRHDMTFGQGLANFASQAEATGQAVKQRLLLLAGEWFLDTTAGVPYLRDVVIKPANLPLAESQIKAAILDTEGVLEIVEFSLDLDRESRRLSVSAKVRTIYDDITDIKANLL